LGGVDRPGRRIIRAMRRSDPTNNVLPRWATILLLPALPGGGAVATLLLLAVINSRSGRVQLFNLSPKDTYLVAVIGAVLIFTISGLLIYCVALMRALRRAVQESTRS
jgi:uncharacterized integral membrane protein